VRPAVLCHQLADPLRQQGHLNQQKETRMTQLSVLMPDDDEDIEL
jgi:hypothetical protein